MKKNNNERLEAIDNRLDNLRKQETANLIDFKDTIILCEEKRIRTTIKLLIEKYDVMTDKEIKETWGSKKVSWWDKHRMRKISFPESLIERIEKAVKNLGVVV